MAITRLGLSGFYAFTSLAKLAKARCRLQMSRAGQFSVGPHLSAWRQLAPSCYCGKSCKTTSSGSCTRRSSITSATGGFSCPRVAMLPVLPIDKLLGLTNHKSSSYTVPSSARRNALASTAATENERRLPSLTPGESAPASHAASYESDRWPFLTVKASRLTSIWLRLSRSPRAD